MVSYAGLVWSGEAASDAFKLLAAASWDKSVTSAFHPKRTLRLRSAFDPLRTLERDLRCGSQASVQGRRSQIAAMGIGNP
jgi:hypothetical protein